MERKRRLLMLGATVAMIVGAIVLIEQPWTDHGCDSLTPTEDGGSEGRPAPDFCASQDWVQGETSLQDLQGEVVLVDFWTYSCINCIRTLPHLTAWYDTYEPYGFTIVGVHTPEFAFEKNPDNVRDAIERNGINYPVVQDNDYRIWDNYHNRFWPAKYLVDPDGRIVYTHFGEGAYPETEALIRELLVANGATNLPPPVEGDTAVSYPGGSITPELYLGYGRQPNTIGNHESYAPGEVVSYTYPETGQRDVVYLDGDWLNGEEAMTTQGPGGLQLRFAAGAANFVADGSGCIEVRLDGAPIPPEQAGRDVDFSGDNPCIMLDGARSYDFYAGPLEEHTLRLAVPDGVGIYTFAFSQFAME